MTPIRILVCVVSMGLLAACSSPEKDAARAQERSYEAQENVALERLKLVEKYQVCVKDAGADTLKIEACDSYLRAAEALK